MKVLVVDDDPAIRKWVAALLEEQGYAVVTAGSGLEAMHLARCQTYSFDLVLSDYVMADMDGLSLAAALRISMPALPVILMSGTSVPSLPPGLGPIRFLEKPFSGARLLDCIQSLGGASSRSATAPK